MVYAYIRVSTEKQNFISQKYSIDKYAEYKGLVINEYLEEKASGRIPRIKRDLGRLCENIAEGDVLIVSELSRLGRSITDTLITLDLLNSKNVTVHLIKENLISGTKEFQMICAVYAIIAQVERERISERTREALQQKIAAGQHIGHYKGFKCTNVKLTPHAAEVKQFLAEGKSIYFIAKHFGVKWITARNFIRDRLK